MAETAAPGLKEWSPAYTLKDLYGREEWKSFLEGFLYSEADGELENDLDQCLLLIGPEGAGKTALLTGLMGSAAKRDYACFRIDCTAAAEDTFRAMAKKLEEGDCCVLLERPESLETEEGIAILREASGENGSSLLLLASTIPENELPREIKKHFLCYGIGLPRKPDRRAYIKATLPGIKYENVTQLVEITENYSYPELRAVVRSAKLHIKSMMQEEEQTAEEAKANWKPALWAREIPKDLNMHPTAIKQQASGIDPDEFHRLTEALEKLTGTEKPQTAGNELTKISAALDTIAKRLENLQVSAPAAVQAGSASTGTAQKSGASAQQSGRAQTGEKKNDASAVAAYVLDPGAKMSMEEVLKATSISNFNAVLAQIRSDKGLSPAAT